ncbi:RNA polymerase II holoenzyme cyclin-like subunit [Cyphellophora attinorum]|uniref:RNA polymerase II holoenzyme cyclin-like subunit n=1 Tax=Cyphellophora attinorum TaxID=1664694 RepID=A0A0N1NY77_9EURO|nr:RNA polymerase II holoenzyme cyclin-like subunit [Phialophora attinorum]KPI38496.1 RNA polymerase II holoenzyme cyclin-like subunit [Phialophora attinorum]
MAANYWESSQHQNWLFTRASLADIRDDLDNSYKTLVTQHPYPDRRLMFIFLRDRILQMVKRLPFRQQCVATALVYMHRFLLSTPMQNVNIYLLVATAFYLASKTEESPHHIRVVAAEARNSWPDFIPGDVSRLGEMEFCLISEMRSQLIVWHPYRTLIDLKDNQNLKLTSDELGLAWCIINDSYMTDLPLTCPPFLIAVIAMFLAVVFYPYSKNSGNRQADLHSAVNLDGPFATMGSRPGMAGLMSSAMHALPMNPPISAASASANGANGRASAAGKDPLPMITPDRQQTLATIASSEKLTNTIKFLVESEIDLKQMINGTQEIISLYSVWEEYHEKSIKEAIARCFKSNYFDS